MSSVLRRGLSHFELLVFMSTDMPHHSVLPVVAALGVQYGGPGPHHEALASCEDT